MELARNRRRSRPLLDMSLSLFSEYNQRDATFLKFIYFCNTLYMFQTVFPSIITSTKLHKTTCCQPEWVHPG